MARSNDETNPRNLFRRGNSWLLDFYFRGERYTETLGPMSRTVAKERRDKRRGDIAAGELAVNGKLWRNKQWVAKIQEEPAKIDDLEFRAAVERYLEWYQANREENSYKRHKHAKKPLIEFFGDKRLSEIAPFDVEKYKLHRKAAKKSGGTVNRELALLRNSKPNSAVSMRSANQSRTITCFSATAKASPTSPGVLLSRRP